MFRLPALLLAALMALTPVMGALCADGCGERGATTAAEPALSCAHGQVPASSTALTAAECSTAPATVVAAEVRTPGSLAAPSISVTLTAAEPKPRAVVPFHLHYRFAPAPLQAVLRI